MPLTRSPHFTASVVAAALLAVAVLFVAGPSTARATPLDEYVRRYDPSYGYTEIAEARIVKQNFVVYVLNMTSQRWLSDADSNAHVWWHYLAIAVPTNVTNRDTAFMWITGGGNHDGPPAETDGDLLMALTMALTTNSVGAVLYQIPNQPIRFTADPTGANRKEDSIIAYTWRHFLDNPNEPEWLLRLPMTKAAVRAMDAIQSFTATHVFDSAVTSFMICGASKRGWTSWTVAAVDDRVVGVVPIVMDALQLVKNMHHFFRSYGGWTFAFEDYYALNITGSLDDPAFAQMADIIDPYVYRDRLTMPKFVISTSGDEFFQLDDSEFFFNDMQGEMYMRIVENAEHSLNGHQLELIYNVQAFYISILDCAERPKFTWSTNHTSGDITIDVDSRWVPVSVKIWHTTTLGNVRRDFRLLALSPEGKIEPQPVIWTDKVLAPTTPGHYVAHMDFPRSGWRAFFVELKFGGTRGSEFTFSTQASIIPWTFPFPDCAGAECRGVLL